MPGFCLDSIPKLGTGEILYGLIDGAQVTPNFLSKIRAYSGFLPILPSSGNDSAELAGPLLLDFGGNQPSSLLSTLLNDSNSHNYLSLLVSSLSLKDLGEKLEVLCEVQFADGSEWIMRFYDPRIFPHWLSILDDIQFTQSLSNIKQWIFMSPNELPVVIEGGGVSRGLSENKQRMTLDENQFNVLMECCMPGMIKAVVARDYEDLLNGIPTAKHYEFFREALAKAKHYGLEEMIDIAAFCTLGLIYGCNVDEMPAVREALVNSRHAPFHILLDTIEID